MAKPLPARGYYVNQQGTGITWWTGTRKGARYMRSDIEGFRDRWCPYHWPCALGDITRQDDIYATNLGPFTLKQVVMEDKVDMKLITAILSMPAPGDKDD